MISYFLLLASIVLSLSCNNGPTTVVSQEIILNNWNLATIESIKKQISSLTDTTDKKLYLNRLSVFKYFTESKSEEVNQTSLRYKFLSKILSEHKNQEDFYIIEADIGGYRVQIRNYLLKEIRRGVYQVEMYQFSNSNWERNQKVVEIDLNMPGMLSNPLLKSRNGINQDDVIVSHINKNGAVNSEFFLVATLSKDSGFEKILELDN